MWICRMNGGRGRLGRAPEEGGKNRKLTRCGTTADIGRQSEAAHSVGAKFNKKHVAWRAGRDLTIATGTGDVFIAISNRSVVLSGSLFDCADSQATLSVLRINDAAVSERMSWLRGGTQNACRWALSEGIKWTRADKG
jgi:hypothetical protein